MIAGVSIRPLAWHADDRGNLVELYRESWDALESWDAIGVAQVYLTETHPGVVKAWHHHEKQMDRFVCVYGSVRLVLYDARPDSDTRGNLVEIVLSMERNARSVNIPPGVVHGWKCISNITAGVVNCVTHEWDGTDEFRRRPADGPADGVDYDWHRRVDS